MATHGLTEDDYLGVADWATYDGLSDGERVALEYADKFGTDHLAIDQALFDRLREFYDDETIVDMTYCLAAWLGLGRFNQVLGLVHSCPLVL